MIELYADGADMAGIIDAAGDPKITGFTTNPTLMRQAGVTDYADFAKNAIKFLSRGRPDTSLSLEVFADDHDDIRRQARIISDWGNEKNYQVYVKVPVMYTTGEPTYDLIHDLAEEGINLNVTAVFTSHQCFKVIDALDNQTSHILSIFAGRIADVGIDPKTIFDEAHSHIHLTRKENIKTLWASSREAYNYQQADHCKVDIITMPPELIKKVKGFGKDLTQFSKETCQMFYNDAIKSGYTI